MLIQDNKHIKEANKVFYGGLIFLCGFVIIAGYMCGI